MITKHNLLAARHASGLSRPQAAAVLGVSQDMLRRHEEDPKVYPAPAWLLKGAEMVYRDTPVAKSKLATYCTSFCNGDHRLCDGVPVEHECYVLDKAKLALEAAGRINEIDGSIKASPERIHRGARRRSL